MKEETVGGSPCRFLFFRFRRLGSMDTIDKKEIDARVREAMVSVGLLN